MVQAEELDWLKEILVQVRRLV